MKQITIALLGLMVCGAAFAGDVRVGTFAVDATPPVGTPLCGGGVPPVAGVQDPLSARGYVLLPQGQDPIVVCAVDWVGIGNGGTDAWRDALAEAAGTPIERVAVHTLHQHDAPACDFTSDELAASVGLGGQMFDLDFARDCIARTAAAVKAAAGSAKPVTHVGTGMARVYGVASNRRIIGEDGKVEHTRWTATADPKVQAFPVGTIDPMARVVSLWNDDEPLAVMSYYATHPQSYYRTGMVSCDFVGLARNKVEEEAGAPWIHFDGAGGNIGAGKWNDGEKERRGELRDKLAAGLRNAWEATEKTPLDSADVSWQIQSVVLPHREETTIEGERATLEDEEQDAGVRIRAAREIAFMERMEAGEGIPIGLLRVGPAAVVHMPGELFIEYQLAAEMMRPDLFVCMAAYGDYGPGYIGTEVAYPQGGYECQVRTSRTSPKVEAVLTDAMAKLLDVNEVPITPSQFTLTNHLFNGQDLDGWYTWLRDIGRDKDPNSVFNIHEGVLRITGLDWGCITSNEEYDRYHLIAEYRWTGKTHAPRVDRARDSGFLVHSKGEDGGYSGTWMYGIEAQIIEGGTGDFLAVGDGSEAYSITSPVSDEMQGSSHVYDPEGEPVTINRGRINWWGRDPDWADVVGFRGQQDVANPAGKWNRYEIIVDGPEITLVLNGHKVNEAFDVKPTEGRIQVQSEGAEILFRRIDLVPLQE